MTRLERKNFIDELRYDEYFWSVMEELDALFDKSAEIYDQPHYDTRSHLLFAMYESIRQLKTVVNK